MQKGDELILNIENLSGEGKTVARQDGVVFFVEHAVPGDRVRAKIWKIQKNFVEARAVEILTPSPMRAEPKCKHFGVCGGCKWQNLAYASQLEFKRRLVRDAFERIGKFDGPDVLPVIGCDEPYNYRNKVEFTFSASRWRTENEMAAGADNAPGVYLGFHVPQRWDKVVDIEECWLQSGLSTAILTMVREVARGWELNVYSSDTESGYLRHLVVREAKHTGEVMVNIVTSTDWPEAMKNLTTLLLKHFPSITTVVNNITSRKSMVAYGESEKVYHGPGVIRERIGEFTFHISANSFFQTNTVQAERLYAAAKAFAELNDRDVVYDLYSGTGTIAIFLARDVERVIGIEVAQSSIADAERNARLNHIPNCYFIQGDLKDRLTKERDWTREHPAPTVVIADPPRSGMHEKVLREIVRLGPRRIVYVSCNPSTQARDAAYLQQGGYALGQIQPVDMFPHTDHIEAVALFVKQG